MPGKLGNLAASGGLLLRIGLLLLLSVLASAAKRIGALTANVFGRQDVADYDGLAEAMATADMAALRRFADVMPGFPNAVDPALGVPCFHVAVELGAPSVVEWMIQLGADLNQYDEAGLCPLTCALLRDDERAAEVLTLLLQAGADPNVHDPFGRTPLHDAASGAPAELVSILLDHGADPAPDPTLSVAPSPIDIARRAGRMDVVRLLECRQSA